MQSATPPSGNPPNNSTASSQAAQEVISNFTKRIDESYSNLLSRTKFLVSEFDKMSAQMAGTFGSKRDCSEFKYKCNNSW